MFHPLNNVALALVSFLLKSSTPIKQLPSLSVIHGNDLVRAHIGCLGFDIKASKSAQTATDDVLIDANFSWRNLENMSKLVLAPSTISIPAAKIRKLGYRCESRKTKTKKPCQNFVKEDWMWCWRHLSVE